jgi:hypothetical protein
MTTKYRAYPKYRCPRNPQGKKLICKCPQAAIDEAQPERSAIICAYTHEQICELLIVRHETERAQLFYAFKTYDEFVAFRETIAPSERVFHEVIAAFQPQHLKFDIDKTDYENHSRQMELAIGEIMRIIKKTYREKYVEIISYADENNNLDWAPADLEFAIAITKHDKKYRNRHVIVSNIHFPNIKHITNFYNYFINSLSAGARSLIDEQVNKQIQNWRIIGSCKLGKPAQIKYSDSIYDSPCDTLVAHRSTINFPRRESKLITYLLVPRVMQNLADITMYIADKDAYGGGDDDDDDTEDVVRSIYTSDAPPELNNCIAIMSPEERRSHKYRDTTINGAKKYINFMRILPSFCNKCGRTHDKDSTLYFAVLANSRIYKCCRHAQLT